MAPFSWSFSCGGSEDEMLINVLSELFSFTRFVLAETCLFHVPEATVEIASPKRKAGTVINDTAIPPEDLNQADKGDLFKIQNIETTAKMLSAVSSAMK